MTRRRRRYVAGVGRSRLGRASHSSGQLARRTGVLDGRRLQRQHRARGEAVERLSEITRSRAAGGTDGRLGVEARSERC